MSDETTPYIVGVGASAGGLEALQQLFENVSEDAGLAFVVVQHLSPDFKSMMPELLARHTTLAVRLAETGTRVGADTVYLIPPRKEMIIQGGVLLLKDREQADGPFLPIDTFLTSLAQDQGSRAIGVILSGSGSDGARGVRAIHESGGTVVVQSEDTAKFSGMPRSAIETGIADAVLPPIEIGPAIERFARTGASLVEPDGAAEPMQVLFELLRSHTGVDFSSYKGSTVLRRIDRRLRITHSATLQEYLDHASRTPEEVSALYQDLLIGVTSFFRDPAAFARLEQEIFPSIVRDLPPGEELRIWIAACATGEEAYSLAILATEALAAAKSKSPLRVFATDVHRASLDVASAGAYGDESLRGVDPARLERFFHRTATGWQVSQELRQSIVFAQHNVLRDAPFTRLDLTSCRNLLIYFKPSAQRRALSLFHFGLKPHGALFLGSSETPGELEEEFVALDPRWKIFRKRREARLHVPLSLGDGASVLPARRPKPRDVADQLVVRANAALAKRFAPPTLIIDSELRVIVSMHGAGKYLVPRDGILSASAMDLVSGELRFVLATALRRAGQEGTAAYNRVSVGDTLLNVTVAALDGTDPPHFVVTLEPDRRPPEAERPASDIDGAARQRVEELELDLKYARENLQATIEEMEASNEELQATNEELVAANEELQSTNEELHSVNEELYTVNAEHQLKIAELTELTTDMDSLLESTQVHTIFLDPHLRIRKFTPRMAQTFKLQPSDVERRINDFAHDLNRAELMDDVERVSRTGVPIEAEVRDRRGHEYLLRVLPYRSNGQIDGVVITLIDIASLKRTQRELRASERRYRALVETTSAVVFTADGSGAFHPGQEHWAAFTGQAAERATGEGWLEAIHPDDRAEVMRCWTGARGESELAEVRARVRRAPHGEHRHCVLRFVPVAGEDGQIERVGCVADEHEHAMARVHLATATARQQAIFDHSPVPMFVKDKAGRYVVASRSAATLLGTAPEQVVGKTDFDFLPLHVAEELRRHDLLALTGEREIVAEERVQIAGAPRLLLSSRFPVRDGSGDIVGVGGVCVDVTERQEATDQIRAALRRRDEFLAMLSHELRNPVAALVNAFYVLDAALPPRAQAAQAVARRQLAALSRLLDDLLDVARLTRGGLEVRREPTRFDLVVRDAFDAAGAEARARGVALEISADEERLSVLGDAVRLQQACMNLLNNAIRFSPPGGRVEVQLRREGEHAVIRVSDRGEGISADDLPRIFDLFYQSEQGIERPKGGLGVGLSLVKQIAERHGGSIEVTSGGRGRGSTFTLRIPVDREQRPDAPAARPVARTVITDRPLRIVLVEDNADARAMLRLSLERDGHAVHEAGDGESGVSLITEERPDMAVVDIGLPGLDGYAVAKQVRRALGRGARLIALTGYGRDEDRAAAIAAGFDAHLTKPVDPASLLNMIAALHAPKEEPGEEP